MQVKNILHNIHKQYKDFSKAVWIFFFFYWARGKQFFITFQQESVII